MDSKTGMSKQGYYIGLDGGGTRTVAMLADAQGRVQAFHRATSTNYHVVGEEKARQTMFSIFDTLLLEAGVPREQLAGVCLGLSGCDRPEDQKDNQVPLHPVNVIICLLNGKFGDNSPVCSDDRGIHTNDRFIIQALVFEHMPDPFCPL